MEAASLISYELGLLVLPLLAVLLMALCVRCRDQPGSYDSATSDGVNTGGFMLKPSATFVTSLPVPSYPPVTSNPSLNPPDVLPILRSTQSSGGSHCMTSPRQDSDGANSVASYENQGPVCEDEDEEEEEDYTNGRYLVVLPDSNAGTSTTAGSAGSPAPGPSAPSLRDSNFSMESGEDYVNVPESKESGNASLNGSREYVNVCEELQPAAETESATRSSQELEEEEEGPPDYENLQELN